jgi:hypothetical protein
VRHDLRRGLRHRLLVSVGVVQELVAAPRSSVALLARGAEGYDPDRWDHGPRRSRWPLSQGSRCGSHPIVGGVVPSSCRTVFGRWALYRSSLSCGVVLSVQCGTKMASDRTEVTPCGVSVTCLFLSEQACLDVLDLSPFLQGSGRGRDRAPIECRAAKARGRGRG